MYVVAVSNHKGGVGKTTTALSVATCLAMRGRRTVAVGLDLQGNLSMGTGLRTTAETPSVFDVMRGKVSVRRAARPVPYAGLEMLRVIPAGKRLAQAEGWLYGKVGYEEILTERLATLAKTNEFAVLDCSPSLGALTMNAIMAADLVLVPVQCEYFSIQGVSALLEMVDVVRTQRRPNLRLHVLPTLYDRRNRICREVLKEIKKQFPHETSQVVVGIDTRVRDAQARGVPLCLHAPHARANLAYEAVALWVEMQALAACGAEVLAA